MSSAPSRQRLHVVIGGHVDHGKSTLVGRLLADTGSLPEGRMEQIRELCRRTGRPFEYAFLLDALKDERAQNITIETARVFFRTPRREYLLLDAPGHVEFVRNLVTGAAQADAAVMVLDAQEGIRENSRRHGYLMSLLGIRQLAVVINKLDLAGYSEAVFRALAEEYAAFLASLGLAPGPFVPASARDGVNLTTPSPELPWYRGPTVLEALEGFAPIPAPEEAPFRMPVQDVYKVDAEGSNDARRIVAGTVLSGRLAAGDELVFFPSGKRARVRRLEVEGAREAAAGEATGFTLEEQIYLTRGELAARARERPPQVALRVRAGLFWLGREPLARDREYLLKLGTARVPVRVESIDRALDAATLAVRPAAGEVARHELAECVLQLARPVALDPAGVLVTTARFVIVDRHEIAGGGLVHEVLPDPQAQLREQVLLRNSKWETSFIAVDRRGERYRQRPTLLLLTGAEAAERKHLAKALEARLFEEGRLVYYIGMANVLYGVDADLGRAEEDRAEHLRRLSEIANLLLDAGVILIVTAAGLTGPEIEKIRTAAPAERVLLVRLGEQGEQGDRVDLCLEIGASEEAAVERLHALLGERGAFLDVP